MTAAPDSAARALHAASYLSWLRWDQLAEDVRAEYRAQAERVNGPEKISA